jgi:hypothetical protein
MSIPRKANLIIDIQVKMKEGKGQALKQWATVYNLKQMAAALQYLQQNNLLAYKDLETKTPAVIEHYYSIGDNLKMTESAMKQNAELKSASIDYFRTHTTFDEYKKKI